LELLHYAYVISVYQDKLSKLNVLDDSQPRAFSSWKEQALKLVRFDSRCYREGWEVHGAELACLRDWTMKNYSWSHWKFSPLFHVPTLLASPATGIPFHVSAKWVTRQTRLACHRDAKVLSAGAK